MGRIKLKRPRARPARPSEANRVYQPYTVADTYKSPATVAQFEMHAEFDVAQLCKVLGLPDYPPPYKPAHFGAIFNEILNKAGVGSVEFFVNIDRVVTAPKRSIRRTAQDTKA